MGFLPNEVKWEVGHSCTGPHRAEVDSAPQVELIISGANEIFRGEGKSCLLPKEIPAPMIILEHLAFILFRKVIFL